MEELQDHGLLLLEMRTQQRVEFVEPRAEVDELAVAGLARRKEGRLVFYALADEHVRHVLLDALAHVAEPAC